MKLVRKYLNTAINNTKKKVLILGDVSDSYYSNEIADIILECYAHYEVFFESEDMALKDKFINQIIDESFIDSCELVVPIITKNFLSGEDKVCRKELSFAIASEKNILPIVIGDIDESIFNNEFGEHHLLYLEDCLFKEKLNSFINEVFDPYMLISESPWGGELPSNPSIFLSYRKKDYHRALEILQTIHGIDGFEVLTVWFDQFLIPGENFNDLIEEKLMAAEFVVMCITKNSLEEDNYVSKIEYPLAKKLGKQIVPVVVEKVDVDLLEKLYPGIDPLVDIEDIDNLYLRIKTIVSKLNINLQDKTPAQIGELGHAYLEGKGVERNLELGLKLTREAASLGYPVSCEKLGRILSGQYPGLVEVDYEEAVKWFEVSLESSYSLLKEAFKNENPREIDSYALMGGNTAICLFEIYKYYLQNTEMAMKYLEVYSEICYLMYNGTGRFTCKVNQGVVNYHYGEYCEELGNFNLALKYYNDGEKVFNALLATKNIYAYKHYTRLLLARANLLKKVMVNTGFNIDIFKAIIHDYENATVQLQHCVEDFSSHQDELVNCLLQWFEYIINFEHSNFLEAIKVVRNSYKYIYHQLEKMGDFKSLKFSYLKSRNALCLACAYKEVPDIQLLNYALDNAKICKEISPEINELDELIRNIEMRIYSWPINLG